MEEYVLGFAFDTHGERLALIRKARPAWQAGRLNGIGGKIESGEAPAQAMVREFREETGGQTHEADWQLLGALHGEHFRVWVYGARLALPVFDALRSVTDERVELVWFNDEGWLTQCLDTVPVLARYARAPVRDLFLSWGHDEHAGPAAFEALIRSGASRS